MRKYTNIYLYVKNIEEFWRMKKELMYILSINQFKNFFIEPWIAVNQLDLNVDNWFVSLLFNKPPFVKKKNNP